MNPAVTEIDRHEQRRLSREADAAARERARTCFDRPLVLEAGAGTGKTATLIARLLTWAIRDGWRQAAVEAVLEAGTPKALATRATEEAVARRVLQRVVAITFTEKAAAEMAARFDQGLRAVIDDRALPGLVPEQLGLDAETRRERAQSLLDVAHCLQVSTIHAFCRKLLAEHSLAAGLHPRFEVDADLSRMRRLADEVLMEALERELGGEASGDLEELIAGGIDPTELAATLRALVDEGVPAAAFAGDPYAPDRVRAVREDLASRLGALASQAGSVFDRVARARGAEQAVQFSREAAARIAEAEDVEALRAAVEVGDAEKVKRKLEGWRSGKLTQTEEKLLGEGRTALREAAVDALLVLDHLRQLDPERLPRLARVLRPMLEEVQRRARRRGIESFALLLRDTRDLLVGQPAVRRAVRASLDQLLVDEFQDTDLAQCELVAALCLPDEASPEPAEDDEGPILFLVGDPKQSIYGWRDADLAAYESFVQRVLAQDGEKHSLTVNYRSVPAILDEVERISAPVMQAIPGFQPAFEGLVPPEGKEDDAGCQHDGRAAVEHWISWAWEEDAEGVLHPVPGTGAEDARVVEARAIARDVREQVEAGVARYRDFALLLRASTRQETYAQALREAGVPSVVEKDRSWYQRREVLDATALARAVLDPSDLLALIAWLRSPTVGLPDAVIAALRSGGLLENWEKVEDVEKVDLREIGRELDRLAEELRSLPPGVLPPGWPVMAKESLRLLGTLRRSLREEPLDRFLHRLRATLAPATEAARYLGEHRALNLEILWRDLRRWLSDEQRTTQDVVRELRRVGEEDRDEQADAPGDDSLDAVRLMTVHKSKGLSFEQVFLVNLHGTSGPAGGAAEDAVEATAAGHEYRLRGARSLGFHRVQERRRRIEDAEAVRLLYVASTRAKRRMVLCGAWPERMATLPDCPIHLVQRRRGADPTPWARDCDPSEAGPGRLDEDGVRWRLPGALEAIEGEQQARQQSVDVRALRRELRQLERWREAAVARQDRVRSVAASAVDAPESLTRDTSSTPGAAQGELFAAPAPRRRDPELAAALGTAVHQALEELDLARPLAEQLEGRDRRSLLRELPARRRAAAEQALDADLCALARSRLLAELERRRDQVLARELPLLVAGERPDEPPITGSIDLLLDDPDTGELIVVDHKTDLVPDDARLQEKGARYAAQGAAYVRAVQATFPGRRVRFELWFLRSDRVWRDA